MRKILVTAIAVAMVSMMFAGCGDDKKSSTGSGKTTNVTLSGKVNDHGRKAGSGEFDLEADNFYFNPTYVTGLKVGDKVKIDIENEGTAEHTFTSPGVGVDQEVQPGEKQEVSFTIKQPGTIEFYCRYHKGSGMRGALIVV